MKIMVRDDETVYAYKMSLIEHLTDLRRCIVYALVSWALGCVVFYQFVDEAFTYLTEPFLVDSLVYIAPAEGFLTYVKLTLTGGLILASPVVVYQLLRFVLPGLYWNEKLALFTLIPGAFLLMLGGMAFGYFVLLPFGLKYLLNFGSLKIQPMLSVAKYIGFVSTTLLILGIIFEIPLIIIGLTRLGIVTPQFLRKSRKYAIVLSTVLGAILTPPDVISQVMMAGPLVLLYEVSIWLSYLFWKKKKQKESLQNEFES